MRRAGEANALEKMRLAFLKDGKTGCPAAYGRQTLGGRVRPRHLYREVPPDNGPRQPRLRAEAGGRFGAGAGGLLSEGFGGWVNIANAYATKRYRSNLINWGMLPFTTAEKGEEKLAVQDAVFFPSPQGGPERG